jgi:hypothetical protein
MKIIKILLIILFSIVGLVLLTALFVPKSYKVEKSIVVHAPKDSVFIYIKHLKNQNDYSVWSKMDPNWKTSFSGEDGTVGFVSAIDASNTKVSWAFSGSFPYPMNIMKLVFNLEKAIGKDFQQGLENMKTIIEKK